MMMIHNKLYWWIICWIEYNNDIVNDKILYSRPQSWKITHAWDIPPSLSRKTSNHWFRNIHMNEIPVTIGLRVYARTIYVCVTVFQHRTDRTKPSNLRAYWLIQKLSIEAFLSTNIMNIRNWVHISIKYLTKLVSSTRTTRKSLTTPLPSVHFLIKRLLSHSRHNSTLSLNRLQLHQSHKWEQRVTKD